MLWYLKLSTAYLKPEAKITFLKSSTDSIWSTRSVYMLDKFSLFTRFCSSWTLMVQACTFLSTNLLDNARNNYASSRESILPGLNKYFHKNHPVSLQLHLARSLRLQFSPGNKKKWCLESSTVQKKVITTLCNYKIVYKEFLFVICIFPTHCLTFISHNWHLVFDTHNRLPTPANNFMDSIHDRLIFNFHHRAAKLI
jgi:hypothetical protein